MKTKKLFWTVGILTTICISLWYFLIMPFFKSIREECKDNRVWKIQKYTVIEKKCLGFAGPYHYPIYLYENGKIIAQGNFINNSECKFEFPNEKGKKIIINICNNEVE